MVTTGGGVVSEQRKCVYCDATFDVNWRAGTAHVWCARTECQRVRRCRAQKARRKRKRGEERKPPSAVTRQRRAAYMKGYREGRPEYRRAEREARKRRRDAQRLEASVVTEAGSKDAAAELYVVDGPGTVTRLRVVTARGRVLTFRAEDGEARNGTASRAGLGNSGGPGFSAVTEAG